MPILSGSECGVLTNVANDIIQAKNYKSTRQLYGREGNWEPNTFAISNSMLFSHKCFS